MFIKHLLDKIRNQRLSLLKLLILFLFLLFDLLQLVFDPGIFSLHEFLELSQSSFKDRDILFEFGQ